MCGTNGENEMADYVVVHGAWAGTRTFSQTVADLEAAGHRVLVPELIGLGLRQGEFHPGIALSDHIDDVETQIAQAGFDRFILAGHSYGGMVITGVATRLGERIDALCYIDAFLPEDGQSLWDVATEWERNWFIDTQKYKPGKMDPIGGAASPPIMGLGPYHPLLTFLEGIRFTGAEGKIPRRAYILATQFQPSPFPQFAARVKDDPAWEYHEAHAGHMVMNDQPQQLLEILINLAG